MPHEPITRLADRYPGGRAYFTIRTPISKVKAALCGITLFGVGLWILGEIFAPGRVSYAHAPGPLSESHAIWENDCAACHQPHAASNLGGMNLFSAGERWRDLTCNRCHQMTPHAGQVHPASTGVEQCGSCHKEHGGRRHSLVRLPDSQCVGCHSQMLNSAHHPPSGEPAGITGFATGHPEFRVLSAKPENRTRKFSHALHMTPGMESGLTYARLVGVTVHAPRGGSKDDPVTLACNACHQSTGEGSGLRTAGSFLPVRFDAHCRTCHPLDVPTGAAEVGGVRVPLAAFTMPHGKREAALRTLLGEKYARCLIDAGITVPKGGLERLVDPAMGTLARVCSKCHDGGANPPPPTPEDSPQFRHGGFGHSSHQALSCTTCHPGTVATSAGKMVEKEPPQIPGIDTCRACHSPPGTMFELQHGTQVRGGGAGNECTHCHKYHDQGSQPPAQPLSISEFLRSR